MMLRAALYLRGGVASATRWRFVRRTGAAVTVPQRFWFSSDEGNDEAATPQVDLAEQRRLVRAQATKVKKYTEEVNERRKEFARKVAVKRAAEEKARAEQQAQDEALRAKRKEEKRIRRQENEVGGHQTCKCYTSCGWVVFVWRAVVLPTCAVPLSVVLAEAVPLCSRHAPPTECFVYTCDHDSLTSRGTHYPFAPHP